MYQITGLEKLVDKFDAAGKMLEDTVAHTIEWLAVASEAPKENDVH